MKQVTLHHGDCLDVLKTLKASSVDAVISDPPYPMVNRSYGKMTVAAWEAMMHGVVRECRRVLKPRGSAVFVLQPNSPKSGKMLPWLWDFQSWCCREWNVVQDAYWWNHATLPTGGSTKKGLLRGSLKPVVWVGQPDCYRDQDAVLWTESQANAAGRLNARCERVRSVSGASVKQDAIYGAAVRRGGVTPFNVLPMVNSTSSFHTGHPAMTPEPLCDWWIRYISPPGGVVLDPYMGSGTTGVAAIKLGHKFIGIEQHAEYLEIARKRIAAAVELRDSKAERAPILADARERPNRKRKRADACAAR